MADTGVGSHGIQLHPPVKPARLGFHGWLTSAHELRGFRPLCTSLHDLTILFLFAVVVCFCFPSDHVT